mmetsp:Transcript_8358/g.23554  ORF Transcript_8358/g.23554 Transcript_8358/m.23554 type:complete len:553 (+) Transcript_8358:86-1744(+)
MPNFGVSTFIPMFVLNYTRYANRSASVGQGWSDVDRRVESLTGTTAIQCQHHCSQSSDCRCVVWGRASGLCTRRTRCDVESLVDDADFDVYTRPRSELLFLASKDAEEGSASTSSPAEDAIVEGDRADELFVVFADRNTPPPAKDLDTGTNVLKGSTSFSCQEHCRSHPECACAVRDRNDGACWRRKHCHPASFFKDMRFDTFLDQEVALPKNFKYVLFEHRNAPVNSAAAEIDLDASAPKDFSPEACQSRCSEDVFCSCAVYETETGTCWTRAHCHPALFVEAAGFNVYVKIEEVSAPEKPFVFPDQQAHNGSPGLWTNILAALAGVITAIGIVVCCLCFCRGRASQLGLVTSGYGRVQDGKALRVHFVDKGGDKKIFRFEYQPLGMILSRHKPVAVERFVVGSYAKDKGVQSGWRITRVANLEVMPSDSVEHVDRELHEHSKHLELYGLRMKFDTGGGRIRSITLKEAPLGMEFGNKLPVTISGFKSFSPAMNNGVQIGWVLCQLGDVDMRNQTSFEQVLKLLMEGLEQLPSSTKGPRALVVRGPKSCHC